MCSKRVAAYTGTHHQLNSGLVAIIFILKQPKHQTRAVSTLAAVLSVQPVRESCPSWNASITVPDQVAASPVCGFGMSVRLILRDKPPPAETEASIISTSQFAEPTKLYSRVLRGPLVLTTCKACSSGIRTNITGNWSLSFTIKGA